MYYYNLLSEGVLYISILACLLSFWVCFKRDVDINFKILLFILVLTVLVEGGTTVLSYITEITGITNILWVYNAYYAIAYVSWLILFYRLNEGKIRLAIPFFIGLFVVSILVEAIFFLDYTTVNLTFPHTVGALSLAIVIVFYFVQILKGGSLDLLKNNLYFWVGSGLLINYLGTLPFRVITNFFTFSWSEVSESVNYLFFNFSFVLGILMYILFCIGLYRYKKYSN